MPEKLHIQKKHTHKHDAPRHKEAPRYKEAADGRQKAAHRHGDSERQSGDKIKDTPGIICIERNVHDDAIVISGTLTMEYGSADLNAYIAEELEKAAQAVKALDGIVGHIKAAVSVTSTDSVSVTDEKAMLTESPLKSARIALAAIVFMVAPEDAENIIRKALAGVRARLREGTMQ